MGLSKVIGDCSGFIIGLSKSAFVNLSEPVSDQRDQPYLPFAAFNALATPTPVALSSENNFPVGEKEFVFYLP